MSSMISPAPSSADPSTPDVRALALSLPLDDPDRHTLDPDDARFAALAPTRAPQDPERVLSGGTVWTLRATGRDGRGLYAPEQQGECPRWVLSSLEDLAEHGVKAVAA